MSKHEDLLAWWELGIEVNRDLGLARLNSDYLERHYAIDQLDEVGDELRGSKIRVASTCVEVCIDREDQYEIVPFQGMIAGRMNGAYYSHLHSDSSILGVYIDRPEITVESGRVDFAFVPFNGATIVPELDASSVLSDGLKGYIDTLVMGDVIQLSKLQALFYDDRTMKNDIFTDAHIQYLNKILPLDDYGVSVVAVQVYQISIDKSERKATQMAEDDTPILGSSLVYSS